jgi:phytoene dehydrogenase-like protein
MQTLSTNHRPIAVIGGGLAGLTAALILAQAGQPVTLFEKSKQLGGRGASQTKQDFIFNLGPHALYADGEGNQILRALGLAPKGAPPNLNGMFDHQGAFHPLPFTPWALMRSPLLVGMEKLAYLRITSALKSIDSRPFADLTVNQWLDRAIGSAPSRAGLRKIATALIRLTTYADAPHLQSAAFALEQVKRALNGGVLYLDGGWQQLVDGLHQRAVAAGVTIHTGAAVTALTQTPHGLTLQTSDGSSLDVAGAILAVDPASAANMLVQTPAAALDSWLPDAPPITFAALELALRRPLRAKAPYVLSMDQPLYYAVHSKAARLAPERGALIHAGYYLPPTGSHPDARAEIERLLFRLDPEWQREIVHQRFLPKVTVAHTITMPKTLGRSRATSAVPGYTDVYAAGDWVGETGMLVDAALSSAQAAARLLLESLGEAKSAFIPHMTDMAVN